MTEPLSTTIAGFADAGAADRTNHTWIRESMGWLALLATRRTYAAQPDLWRLGEQGRARTIEDFTHHLRSALGGDTHWRSHLDYSVRLFDARGFPQRWLLDAFVTLREVLADTFPAEVTEVIRQRLEDAPGVLDELATAAGIDLARPTKYDRVSP